MANRKCVHTAPDNTIIHVIYLIDQRWTLVFNISCHNKIKNKFFSVSKTVKMKIKRISTFSSFDLIMCAWIPVSSDNHFCDHFYLHRPLISYIIFQIFQFNPFFVAIFVLFAFCCCRISGHQIKNQIVIRPSQLIFHTFLAF